MPKKPLPLTFVLLLTMLLSALSLARHAAAQPPTPTPVEHAIFDSDHATTDIQPLDLSPLATDTSIAGLVGQVDGNRWYADVETLAKSGAVYPNIWGTRHLYSDGNLVARDWISATLASLGWKPYYRPFYYFNMTGYNVVGERVGIIHPEEIYIVGAHFDSTSRDSDIFTLAPGAEDNASGTTALLEIARVLKDERPASTIRLIAFSGEEEGLIGSRAYVSYLKDVTHELDNVKGMYNLDMIGFTSNPNNHHVVLESYAPNIYPWMGDFRDHLASMARSYTDLKVYTSDYPGGSDHFSFLREEVPAVLLIGAEFTTYRDLGYYHSQNDLPQNVVPAEGAEIIKAVVAALAQKAGVICIYADVTCDGTVDVADLLELAKHWRLSPGTDLEQDDLNHDNQINIVDIQLAAGALSR